MCVVVVAFEQHQASERVSERKSIHHSNCRRVKKIVWLQRYCRAISIGRCRHGQEGRNGSLQGRVGFSESQRKRVESVNLDHDTPVESLTSKAAQDKGEGEGDICTCRDGSRVSVAVANASGPAVPCIETWLHSCRSSSLFRLIGSAAENEPLRALLLCSQK